MTTKIIAFSGYKQCGKNTCCEFLTRNFRELWPLYSGQKEELVIRTYSFADKIKEFCQECLGLTHEQVWGSEADKASLTKLRWEDMPGIITPLKAHDLYSDLLMCKSCDGNVVWTSPFDPTDPCKCPIINNVGIIIHESGPMTARAVMQYFGTEICRKMYTNIWADACIRQIQKDNLPIALICDMRFPNEFEAIEAANGTTVRLTRQVIKGDLHASETSLDADKFDWNRFDIILHNETWCVAKQNKELVNALMEHKIIESE